MYFPPVGPENLIRLGEDLLRASSILNQELQLTGYSIRPENRECVSEISDLMSINRTSPTGLSSKEAAELAKTFRRVLFPTKSSPSP